MMWESVSDKITKAFDGKIKDSWQFFYIKT